MKHNKKQENKDHAYALITFILFMLLAAIVSVL